MDTANFTVIIPAHDEAAVIARCLTCLYEDAPAEAEFEVIVVANGCSDQTAQIARGFAPQVKVIEVAEASKPAAMNAGRAAASYFPQVFLDADVVCNFGTLQSLTDALENSEVLAAVPKARFDTSGCSSSVRAYYKVWQKQHFASSALGGSGCFAIAAQGLERIGPFPAIIADDLWALSRFAGNERMLVTQDSTGQSVYSTITPPQTAIEQVRVEARRRIGSEQVRSHFPSSYLPETGTGVLKSAFSGGTAPVAVMTFAGMKLASKLLAEWCKLRGQQAIWVRDHSSRSL